MYLSLWITDIPPFQ